MFGTPRNRLGGLLVCLVAVTSSPVWAQDAGTDATPAQLWADFNHYVLIARPDLAAAAGQVLADTADTQALLDAVESGEYENYENNLQRAQKFDAVRDVAVRLEQQIQAARIERSREPDRIQSDIEQLAEGRRPYRNAVARLSSAGQFAAPQLLATLRDPAQQRLHPYVIRAMVAVGEPMVAPLSQALPDLKPATQAQVAQVLGEIGYPEALPALKKVADNSSTDPNARQVVQAAYRRVLDQSTAPSTADAATLYLLLGEKQYRLGTSNLTELSGYDASQDRGIIWAYGDDIGLVPVPVPGAIYGDAIAMRSAKEALTLNESLDSALSLWLMANLRRENNLPEGEVDPSYASDMAPAQYYAMLAGPDRLQDVLARALEDKDAALSLDAIEALSNTAGTDALVNRGLPTQPLIDALGYPNPLVRFRAAEALTNARPQSAFAGSFRVVPVLKEALRLDEKQRAVVLGANREGVNSVSAALRDLGYDTIGGLSLADVEPQVNSVPAIDLIVVDAMVDQVEAMVDVTEGDYQLGAQPILALVPPEAQARVHETFRSNPRVNVSSRTEDPAELRAAVDAAVTSYGGTTTDPEGQKALAARALELLNAIALDSAVYNVADAEPALIETLRKADADLVRSAAEVLALVNSGAAQSAIADAALDGSEGEQQIALLGSLSHSARNYGNLLTPNQVQRLMALIEGSDGDLAIAAAEAHGALSLPTSDAVDSILGK